MFAHFQSFGSLPDSTDVSKIMLRDVARTVFSSNTALGCMLSGPGDLDIFNLDSALWTTSPGRGNQERSVWRKLAV